MMNHQRIIETLDTIDTYLIRNVNAEGKIKDAQNIFARTYLIHMQEIRKYLDENGIKGAIRTRLEQTENALSYATDRANLNPNNDYFNWINSKKQERDCTKPSDTQIYYDIRTGHLPIVFTNYAREYLPDILGKEELFYSMDMIEQEYQKFLNQDKTYEKTQETALVVRKRNPIQRFFDKLLRRGEYSKKQERAERKPVGESKTNNRHSEYCQKLSNYSNYDSRTQKTEYSQRHKPERIIAVSDIHGNIEKWNAIKRLAQENPNVKLLILGDAIDRGGYGIEILLQIKELCDQGRAEYLPGNHDTFLYNYVKARELLSNPFGKSKNQTSSATYIAKREQLQLERNGGETTLNSLRKFTQIVEMELKKGNISRNIKSEELIDWLGEQPIQKKMDINNRRFAIAHAYFDDELYNIDKNFNLKKALQLEICGKGQTALNTFRTIMWYRENDSRTHYAPVTFPKGCVMVVGHTPQTQGINARRFAKGGEYDQVIYIDTGKKISAYELSSNQILQFGEYDVAR